MRWWDQQFFRDSLAAAGFIVLAWLFPAVAALLAVFLFTIWLARRLFGDPD